MLNKVSMKVLLFMASILALAACSATSNPIPLEVPTATLTAEPTQTASPTIEATQTPTAMATACPTCPPISVPLPTLSSDYIDLEPEELIRKYYELEENGRFILSYQLLSQYNHWHRSNIIYYINNEEIGMELYKTELNVVKEQEIRFDPDLCRVVYVESTTTPDPMGVEEKRNSKMDFYVVKEDGQWRILDNGISDRILARNICEMYIEGRYP